MSTPASSSALVSVWLSRLFELAAEWKQQQQQQQQIQQQHDDDDSEDMSHLDLVEHVVDRWRTLEHDVETGVDVRDEIQQTIEVEVWGNDDTSTSTSTSTSTNKTSQLPASLLATIAWELFRPALSLHLALLTSASTSTSSSRIVYTWCQRLCTCTTSPREMTLTLASWITGLHARAHATTATATATATLSPVQSHFIATCLPLATVLISRQSQQSSQSHAQSQAQARHRMACAPLLAPLLSHLTVSAPQLHPHPHPNPIPNSVDLSHSHEHHVLSAIMTFINPHLTCDPSLPSASQHQHQVTLLPFLLQLIKHAVVYHGPSQLSQSQLQSQSQPQSLSTSTPKLDADPLIIALLQHIHTILSITSSFTSTSTSPFTSLVTSSTFLSHLCQTLLERASIQQQITQYMWAHTWDTHTSDHDDDDDDDQSVPPVVAALQSRLVTLPSYDPVAVICYVDALITSTSPSPLTSLSPASLFHAMIPYIVQLLASVTSTEEHDDEKDEDEDDDAPVPSAALVTRHHDIVLHLTSSLIARIPRHSLHIDDLHMTAPPSPNPSIIHTDLTSLHPGYWGFFQSLTSFLCTCSIQQHRSYTVTQIFRPYLHLLDVDARYHLISHAIMESPYPSITALLLQQFKDEMRSTPSSSSPFTPSSILTLLSACTSRHVTSGITLLEQLDMLIATLNLYRFILITNNNNNNNNTNQQFGSSQLNRLEQLRQEAASHIEKQQQMDNLLAHDAGILQSQLLLLAGLMQRCQELARA